jgi:hypothetical protein
LKSKNKALDFKVHQPVASSRYRFQVKGTSGHRDSIEFGNIFPGKPKRKSKKA